jgi:hypothetical protein
MGAHEVITHAPNQGGQWVPLDSTCPLTAGGRCTWPSGEHVEVVDSVCRTCGGRWVPDAQPEPPAPVSKLCPNVWTGCAHSLAMSEEGVGVACVEWCDARGITWVESPVGVSLGKPSDGMGRNDLRALARVFGGER